MQVAFLNSVPLYSSRSNSNVFWVMMGMKNENQSIVMSTPTIICNSRNQKKFNIKLEAGILA